ncbi:MAG: DUF302 domain-containing protein [Maricaulaceae bacterium]
MFRTFARPLAAALVFGGLAMTAQAATDDQSVNTLITKPSPHSVAETVAKMKAALEGAGITIFGEVDHAKGAASVDLELDDAVVLMFGNPRIGTPLMQSNIRAGLDLPLKALIYSKGGITYVAYLDPAELKARYGLDGVDPVIARITGALNNFSNAAITE